MKILAIDYGTKRIGLAISDETKTLAREYNILPPKQFWQDINQVIESEGVSEVVVGLPLNMSGEDSQKTMEARKFAAELQQKISISVRLVDERLSSLMAGQVLDGQGDVDSLAAQIFLQNYLDQQKQNN